MPLPVESEKELSVGGFQGIKKIKGLLVDIDVVNPPETWENTDKQVVLVKTEDTTVLEMFGDEELFELKEGKFSFYIPYVEAGKKPSENSVYGKCWLASAKEQGKVPSQFIGQYVTLEKQARLLFDKYVSESEIEGNMALALDENGMKKVKTIKGKEQVLVHIYAATKTGRPNHFCFVPEDGADGGASMDDYIKGLVTGLNQHAALRKLLTDVKAKQHPDYKDDLNSGKLADRLGLVVVDDKFQVKEEKKNVG